MGYGWACVYEQKIQPDFSQIDGTKGHLEKEFADIIEKVERLYGYIQEDAKRFRSLTMVP
jgi:hypothetical protein